MPGKAQPLVSNQAIVRADGTPTDYFIRWAQQRQIDITQGVNADTVHQFIDDAIASYVQKTRQVKTGTGLAGGGDLSVDRTIRLQDTMVIAGTYGASTKTLRVTVDAQGRLTDVEELPISGGGGGGKPMLYDLSKGVPHIADIATIGTAGMYSFTENLGVALNAKYNGGAGGSCHLGGFLVPGKSSAASCEVAVMCLPNMDRRNYHGSCIGVYNSSSGRFLVLANCGAAGYFGYSLQNWYAHDNRADINEPGRSVPSYGPHWLHMRFDATAGLFWFGASTDGANPLWYWTAAQNIGLGFIGSFDRIFFGSFDQGAEEAPYTSNTFLCYDDDSAGRLMGTG